MDTADKVASELRELRRSVGDLSRRIVRVTDRRVDRTADSVEHASEEALRKIKGAAETLERRLSRLETSVSQTVREHPKTVVGSVVGLALVGLLLAILFNRDR